MHDSEESSKPRISLCTDDHSDGTPPVSEGGSPKTPKEKRKSGKSEAVYRKENFQGAIKVENLSGELIFAQLRIIVPVQWACVKPLRSEVLTCSKLWHTVEFFDNRKCLIYKQDGVWTNGTPFVVRGTPRGLEVENLGEIMERCAEFVENLNEYYGLWRQLKSKRAGVGVTTDEDKEVKQRSRRPSLEMLDLMNKRVDVFVAQQGRLIVEECWSAWKSCKKLKPQNFRRHGWHHLSLDSQSASHARARLLQDRRLKEDMRLDIIESPRSSPSSTKDSSFTKEKDDGNSTQTSECTRHIKERPHPIDVGSPKPGRNSGEKLDKGKFSTAQPQRHSEAAVATSPTCSSQSQTAEEIPGASSVIDAYAKRKAERAQRKSGEKKDMKKFYSVGHDASEAARCRPESTRKYSSGNPSDMTSPPSTPSSPSSSRSKPYISNATAAVRRLSETMLEVYKGDLLESSVVPSALAAIITLHDLPERGTATVKERTGKEVNRALNYSVPWLDTVQTGFDCSMLSQGRVASSTVVQGLTRTSVSVGLGVGSMLFPAMGPVFPLFSIASCYVVDAVLQPSAKDNHEILSAKLCNARHLAVDVLQVDRKLVAALDDIVLDSLKLQRLHKALKLVHRSGFLGDRRRSSRALGSPASEQREQRDALRFVRKQLQLQERALHGNRLKIVGMLEQQWLKRIAVHEDHTDQELRSIYWAHAMAFAVVTLYVKI